MQVTDQQCHLVRGRECFVGLSILFVHAGDGPAVPPGAAAGVHHRAQQPLQGRPQQGLQGGQGQEVLEDAQARLQRTKGRG